MTEAEIRDIVERFTDKAWNGGDLDLIDELFATDYVGHDAPRPEPVHGPEGMKDFLRMYHHAFSDAHITLDDVLVAGDKVVTRWTGTGTHDGDLMGIPATGQADQVHRHPDLPAGRREDRRRVGQLGHLRPHATVGEDMSTLVVGATGFLGSQVCKELAAQGKPVAGMVRGWRRRQGRPPQGGRRRAGRGRPQEPGVAHPGVPGPYGGRLDRLGLDVPPGRRQHPVRRPRRAEGADRRGGGRRRGQVRLHLVLVEHDHGRAGHRGQARRSSSTSWPAGSTTRSCAAGS